MQKLIAGLSACQKSMEEVIKKVQSSNDRIEELADKVKALDDKVEKIMTSDHNGDSQNSGDNGKKRKRTKSSLVLQVSVCYLHLFTVLGFKKVMGLPFSSFDLLIHILDR